ncbi:phage terminase small subunit P27 family [Reinekea sp.]|jgi:P27 family predicted phage terminase small subunit|uniref:phage terminase small subunit P27 family n=1 Tax=Reinekea sp. TaxID=1970455 RepID=UPI003988F8C8
MGRKKIPTALKVVGGTARKDRMNPHEPDFGELKQIEPPLEIENDPIATGKWNELANALAKAGVLKTTDKDVLMLYCKAFSRYWEAQSDLEENGLTIMNFNTGMPVRNPAAMIQNEAARQINAFGSKLGLDPSSRQNIAGKDKGVGQNRWAEFD